MNKEKFIPIILIIITSNNKKVIDNIFPILLTYSQEEIDLFSQNLTDFFYDNSPIYLPDKVLWILYTKMCYNNIFRLIYSVNSKYNKKITLLWMKKNKILFPEKSILII
jgi:hypothetical protein